MVLGAYIDGSGGGTETLVLAGYIASAEKWADFSVRWEQALGGIKAKSFKASKMHKTARKLRKSEEFYRIIEDTASHAFSCVVRKNDIEDAVGAIEWPPFIRNPEVLANPYYFSFKAIVNVLLQHAVPLGIDQPINFGDYPLEAGIIVST